MNGKRMTDEELTRAYETYCDMVFRIAYSRTKSIAHAEDIQQDVFLAMVRYSDRIRDEQHLKAWLIRVTQNACKKHFRSLWIRLTVMYDDELYKEQEDKGENGVTNNLDQTPSDAEDDRIELIQEMVEKLPEISRVIVHLFYYEKMSVREIAHAVGMSEQNVKTRLSRARDKLRQWLEEETS